MVRKVTDEMARKTLKEGQEIIVGEPDGAPGGRMIGLAVRNGDKEAFLEIAAEHTGASTPQISNAKEYLDKPSNSEVSAKGVKNFAFRTTMQLRAIAADMGVNPVEILLWQSAGLCPRFTTRVDPETGRLKVVPLINGETGHQQMLEIDPTMQLVAAKEASKYLFPQLKAIDLAKEITDGTGADSKVAEAFNTFAGLARQVLMAGETSVVVAVESPDTASEVEE